MTDDQQARRTRRDMLRILLAITFSGGFLAGLVAASIGIPAVWLPLVIVFMVASFLVVIR